MLKITVIIISLLLFSCTAISVGSGKGRVTVKPQQPFCDIKQVDPNCKINKQIKLMNELS
jgi:hypothetical protein